MFTGIGVSPGTVIAPALQLAPPVPTSAEDERADTAGELTAMRNGFTNAVMQLRAEAGRREGDARDVLEVAAQIADDSALHAAAEKHITEGAPAAHAVTLAAAEFATMLERLGGYMAERAADLRGVRDRVVASIKNVALPGIPQPGYPYVLVAKDLTPADTATLGGSDVAAIVTEEGGPTSHTAILARALGIPAVVAVSGATAISAGTDLLVNGARGVVVADPTEEQRLSATAAEATALLTSGPGQTQDGHRVSLLANIAGPGDSAAAHEADAEGVGLFRTEFAFLDRASAPSFEEQKQLYVDVLAQFPGRKVVARTLDAGADKPLPFLPLGTEENPALGVRGLRTRTRFPALLETQLHALAAAAAETSADLWVMAPMVATTDDAAEFAALARQYGLQTAGAMIEVPSAALRAGDILTEAAFVSIGTNDLTQYTLAADRMLGAVAHLLDPWQPALLDLVALTAAVAEGKPVGVCGEAAADPLLALVFTGLGVSSLSMTPRAIAAVRTALHAVTHEQCQQFAAAARKSRTAAQARSAVRALAPASLLSDVGLS
ncbi:phosphoenolpyruvate--protein phosphotransferase [Hoyosella sp. YIM 151337]|uniref:phosphoenolpyruvate--protein phosphotransferase n=1 Tax=Hoyosella sp. YIM 151337 TaxID=2992742 RepID=UPI0022366F7A|nr:phosphoenolpyruvate--protein phosphotransferase [Hoyosella sp. YIM 151337]MCW4351952.1 phosphoenolpyruvate--protein phosphotransferase [Hoyosella sp. YIM 151337]